MDVADIDNIYEKVLPLVREAGNIFVEGFNSTKNVEMKKEFYDVVTVYDKRIELFLISEISKLYPNHLFIAEESSENKINTLTDTPTWIIDPIDGTSNFIKGMPHACISVALSMKKKIVIGIVNNPITNTFFTAVLGKGAFKNNEKLATSKNIKSVKEACIGYEVSLLHVDSIMKKHLKRIEQIAAKSRMTLAYGSVVMSICYVASGALDAYTIEDMFPWDCAAASLILTEAGGFLKHTNGGEYDIMNPHIVCACNEDLGMEILKLIKYANDQ